MSDLISRDALLKSFDNEPMLETYNDCVTVARIIKEQPTLDAAPVVHGRWECAYNENTGETDLTCSRCKDTRTINGCYVSANGDSCYNEDDFCPNCGAKMDKEDEGE